MTNVTTTPTSISKGVLVATVYSVNNCDIPRIQSLLKPLPQSYAVEERIILNVPTPGSQPNRTNLDEANIGQLSPPAKEALMEVQKEYAEVFAADPKAAAACRRPPMRRKLKDPNRASYIASIRHYTSK